MAKRIIRRNKTAATDAPAVDAAKVEAPVTETAKAEAPKTATAPKRIIRKNTKATGTAKAEEKAETKPVVKAADKAVKSPAPAKKRAAKVVKKVVAQTAAPEEEVIEDAPETDAPDHTVGRQAWAYTPRRETREAREIEVGGSILRDDLFKLFQASIAGSEDLADDVKAALSNPTKVKALFETFEQTFQDEVIANRADVRIFGMKGRVRPSAARISPVPCDIGRFSLIPERAYYKFKPALLASDETTINLEKDENGNFFACTYDEAGETVMDEAGQVKLEEFLNATE